MTNFTLTAEQEACTDAARNTQDNLIISALAGAAKTSTLVCMAEALKRYPTLCLAFNKKIAVEMENRLPGNCTSMTLNSLGHRAWAKAIGKRLTVDTRKCGNILKSIIDDLPKPDKEAAWDAYADILKAISHGKACGYIPSSHPAANRGLVNDDEFFAGLEIEPTALEEQLIRLVSLESIRLGHEGVIDFDDQNLLPTIFPVSFPQFPIVMIDEAQDLSPLNHATLRKLAKKRLIAVGDECQAIYGFRGADEHSMGALQEDFNMRKLTLSISFRCPISVVQEARWRAPHMQWPEWAQEGTVKKVNMWTIKDLPEHPAIICRNNAPLFALGVRLLQAGRYPQIIGNDIGKSLLKIMKKFGDVSLPQETVLAAIDKWETDMLRRSRRPGTITDRAECLRIFANAGANLGAAISYAEHLMNSQGKVQLMTGHKSKGLEFDDVFILDEHLIKDEGQDLNLRYVMQTRAKNTLTYITSDGFEGE